MIEQCGIVGFHQLEATALIWLNPTVDVVQAVGHHSSLFMKPFVNGSGVAVLEMFDHHVEHYVLTLERR